MNETIQSAALIRDVEHVLSEWRETMQGDDKYEAVVRGMSQEIRGVLYTHFADASA